MTRTASIIIVAASVAFLIAAFLPITTVFVIDRDIARIQSRPIEWASSLVLFAVGGMVTAVGLGLLTLQLRSLNSAAGPAVIGFVSVMLGAVCWTVIVYLRYTLPLEIVLREPTLGWWFVAYTLLTQAALIAYGLALVQAGYPRWLGISTMGLAAGSFLAYVVFKDMPPFAHYVITLMIGVALLFA